jgi:glycosyltransferase involved in cell wall biosynthesis
VTRVLAPAPRAPLEPLATSPSFSVVIPTYQAADTVGDAVRSVLDQAHPADEVIVVDDGSTDNLEGALLEFRSEIRVVQKQNGGGASALNAGATAASSDFLAILDSDDVYHPLRLQALAELTTARPDLDLVTTDAVLIRDGERIGRFAEFNPFATDDQRQAILWSCFPGGWPAVRLSTLRAVGGFDESMRIAYDWDCWLRLIISGSTAGLVDEPYYEYRLHPGSLISNRQESLWDRVRLLEKAAQNPGLDGEEQRVLWSAIRSHRTRAVRADVQDGLSGQGDRHRLVRHAFSNIAPRARLDVALAVIAPRLARRVFSGDAAPGRRLSRQS